MTTLEWVVLRWSGPHQQLVPATVDKISNLNLHFDFRFGLIKNTHMLYYACKMGKDLTRILLIFVHY